MKDAGYEWNADKKKLKKKSQRMISAEAKEALYDKPAWKPSDEQMDALETAVSSLQSTALETLYDNLKRL